MTVRLSNAQITALRTIQKGQGMHIDKIVQYNQIFFVSLLRRGLLQFNEENEYFSVSELGRNALDLFAHGDIKDFRVKGLSEPREARIHERYHNPEPSKPKRRKKKFFAPVQPKAA